MCQTNDLLGRERVIVELLKVEGIWTIRAQLPFSNVRQTLGSGGGMCLGV